MIKIVRLLEQKKSQLSNNKSNKYIMKKKKTEEVLYKSEIDGMDPLLAVFNNNKDSFDEFIDHFFENVKFFQKGMVEKQSKTILEKVTQDEPLPVRFSLKSKKYFHYKNESMQSGISKKSFKNKSDAQNFTLGQELIHNETGLNVCIDKDGNYFVRKEIFDAVNYRVSQGAISDIKNYMICHVWGETANPLFFTSLWNVTLIPNYMSFLTDKPDENSVLVRKIKDVLKVICMELYQPKEMIKSYKPDYDSSSIFNIPEASDIGNRKYLDEVNSLAKRYLEDGTVKFMDKKSTIEQEIEKKGSQNVTESNSISSDSLENKDFIVLQLKKLADVDDEMLILSLADTKECKDKFDVAFSILREFIPNDKSVFEDNLGRQRYYKKDTFFEYNDKKYIICNHWYKKQRDLFELWVYDNINL